MIVDKLREEIIESQKARTDLIKWKLIVVAAIGATAVKTASAPSSPFLLAFIPFVCLYVDTVCFHNDLRIMAIASFLRNRPREVDPESWDYEQHCSANRASFPLEAFALQGATLVISALIAYLGLTISDKVIEGFFQAQPGHAHQLGCFLAVAGISGFALSVITYLLYWDEMRTLDGKAGWKAAQWVKRRGPRK